MEIPFDLLEARLAIPNVTVANRLHSSGFHFQLRFRTCDARSTRAP